MKRFASVVLCCLSSCVPVAAGQNTPSNVDISSNFLAMKTAYAASGSIVAVDKNTIVIEPKMPAPLCAMPKNENGTTTWSFYTFPLASITVPLTEVDETLISEDRVFSSPDAPRTYKPGDMGDTTMVVVAVMPGKQFHTRIYDLDRFTHLGPGPHSSKEYGETPDDTEAFGLTFADAAAARSFAIAFKNAVISAKAQAAQSARP